MITLPKSWAESSGLKKNDPIILVPKEDGSLLLTLDSSETSKNSMKRLNIDDFSDPDALYRCLIGAYIAGHNQIAIESESPIKGQHLEAISEFTQTSMGMEIIEEDENRILIKDLIDHSEVIPQKNVRREYLLVKRMIADALSKEPPTLKEMDLRDTEVDRIHWLVQRQASIYQNNIGLSSSTGLRLATVMSCTSVSRILERIGDHAVLIVKNLSGLDESDRREFKSNLENLNKELLKFIEIAVESWMQADNTLAEKAIGSKKNILTITNRCFTNVVNKDAGNLLLGNISRIIDYCCDIAESAINVAMEKP